MRWILTALIFLFGLFDLFMGLNFLFNPQTTATGFGLAATGTQGMSTLRADFAAFFGVVALCMMLGAWRRNGDLLLVPAGLFGVALLGRCVSLAIDGPWDGYLMPMVVEGAMVILLLIASRVLPHRVG